MRTRMDTRKQEVPVLTGFLLVTMTTHRTTYFNRYPDKNYARRLSSLGLVGTYNKISTFDGKYQSQEVRC
jgi:hypothetical protein